MDKQTANELAAGGFGMLVVGDRTLIVGPPTDADMGTLTGELRRLFKAAAVSPLSAVMEDFDKMPPAMRKLAVEAAVAQGGAKQVEPTAEQIGAQIMTAAGCRFWVWWLARKAEPTLTLADLEAVITDANVFEVLASLRVATKVEKAIPLADGRPSSQPG